MAMILEVVCDCCGETNRCTEISQGLEQFGVNDLNDRNECKKDLCSPCFTIVKALIWRTITPEKDDFGGVSIEQIRASISTMAERRKQVFEEGQKTVRGGEGK